MTSTETTAMTKLSAEETPVSCPICFRENIELMEIGTCTHKACFACLQTWLQAIRPRDNMNCFSCRQALDPAFLIKLGLNITVDEDETEYISTTEGGDAEILDDLTRDWLQDNYAKECKHCGIWITKNGGCNHMECICGYEFCWYCLKEWSEGCNCDDDDFEDEEQLRLQDEAFEALALVFGENDDVDEEQEEADVMEDGINCQV